MSADRESNAFSRVMITELVATKSPIKNLLQKLQFPKIKKKKIDKAIVSGLQNFCC